MIKTMKTLFFKDLKNLFPENFFPNSSQRRNLCYNDESFRIFRGTIGFRFFHKTGNADDTSEGAI
jgi:hypothetical protein